MKYTEAEQKKLGQLNKESAKLRKPIADCREQDRKINAGKRAVLVKFRKDKRIAERKLRDTIRELNKRSGDLERQENRLSNDLQVVDTLAVIT